MTSERDFLRRLYRVSDEASPDEEEIAEILREEGIDAEAGLRALMKAVSDVEQVAREQTFAAWVKA